MNDLRVEARFKNARLYNAIYEQFAAHAKVVHRRSGAMPVGRLAAEAMGIKRSQLSAYLSLRESPYKQDGAPKVPALRICAILDRPMEYLFPQGLYRLAPILPRVIVKEYQSSQVLASKKQLNLPPPQETIDSEIDAKRVTEKLLWSSDLSVRQRKVIILRFGLEGNEEHSLEEIAAKFGVSKERIRQLEYHALRKLRTQRGFVEKALGAIPR